MTRDDRRDLQKGGVAKTTTTANLAVVRGRQGLRVLCVDLDPQSALTRAFGRRAVAVHDLSPRGDARQRRRRRLGDAGARRRRAGRDAAAVGRARASQPRADAGGGDDARDVPAARPAAPRRLGHGADRLPAQPRAADGQRAVPPARRSSPSHARRGAYRERGRCGHDDRHAAQRGVPIAISCAAAHDVRSAARWHLPALDDALTAVGAADRSHADPAARRVSERDRGRRAAGAQRPLQHRRAQAYDRFDQPSSSAARHRRGGVMAGRLTLSTIGIKSPLDVAQAGQPARRPSRRPRRSPRSPREAAAARPRRPRRQRPSAPTAPGRCRAVLRRRATAADLDRTRRRRRRPARGARAGRARVVQRACRRRPARRPAAEAAAVRSASWTSACAAPATRRSSRAPARCPRAARRARRLTARRVNAERSRALTSSASRTSPQRPTGSLLAVRRARLSTPATSSALADAYRAAPTTLTAPARRADPLTCVKAHSPIVLDG